MRRLMLRACVPEGGERRRLTIRLTSVWSPSMYPVDGPLLQGYPVEAAPPASRSDRRLNRCVQKRGDKSDDS